MWDALLQTLVDLGPTDDRQYHDLGPCVAKGGPVSRVLVDHAAALRAKFTPAATIKGLPLGFMLTGGQASDYGVPTISSLRPAAPLANKGYDGDRFRENLLMRGILPPIVPPRYNRKAPDHPDYRRYRDHNRVERMLGKLRDWHRIHSRYDRCAHTFISAICIVATVIFWLSQ